MNDDDEDEDALVVAAKLDVDPEALCTPLTLSTALFNGALSPNSGSANTIDTPSAGAPPLPPPPPAPVVAASGGASGCCCGAWTLPDTGLEWTPTTAPARKLDVEGVFDLRSQGGAGAPVVPSRVCWLIRDEVDNRRVFTLPNAADDVDVDDGEELSSPCTLIVRKHKSKK
ncbi:hypothetical protein MD484_g1591, partial [Candolleomyces efflorescens]